MDWGVEVFRMLGFSAERLACFRGLGFKVGFRPLSIHATRGGGQFRPILDCSRRMSGPETWRNATSREIAFRPENWDEKRNDRKIGKLFAVPTEVSRTPEFRNY